MINFHVPKYRGLSTQLSSYSMIRLWAYRGLRGTNKGRIYLVRAVAFAAPLLQVTSSHQKQTQNCALTEYAKTFGLVAVQCVSALDYNNDNLKNPLMI